MNFKESLPTIILVVLFLISSYFFFRYKDKRAQEHRFRTNQEYPELTVKDSVSGRIEQVYHGDLDLYRNVYYQVYVTLFNGKKLSLSGHIEGQQNPPTIDEVVEKGDSLLKRPNQSSFTIIKLDSQMTASRYEFKFRQ
jgi:hypothetical protein